MLINVKMSTIVDILTFMSRINVVLRCVEHEKRFVTSEPGTEISHDPQMSTIITVLVHLSVHLAFHAFLLSHDQPITLRSPRVVYITTS